MLSAHGGWDAYRGMRSCWVEHYILKSVVDALFLAVQNVGNSE